MKNEKNKFFTDQIVVYSYADSCRRWRRATQFLEKYTSHFIWKGSKRVTQGFTWSWRPNRTATYCPPLLCPSVLCLSRSPGLLNRKPGGPILLGACFLYCIFSPTGMVSKLVSKLTDLTVFTELYNTSIAHSIFGMACLIVIKRK